MRILTVIVVLMCLVGLASCKRGPANWSANHVVTEADLPGRISAHVGETIAVSLASNASTGYSWHCTWQPEGALVKLAEKTESSGTNMPGAGGKTHFILKAEQAGRVVVTVQYGRWWQGGEREKPRRLTITVTP